MSHKGPCDAPPVAYGASQERMIELLYGYLTMLSLRVRESRLATRNSLALGILGGRVESIVPSAYPIQTRALTLAEGDLTTLGDVLESLLDVLTPRRKQHSGDFRMRESAFKAAQSI